MPLTNSQLEGLSRFARLPEGQVFVQHLKQRLAEHDRKLRTATGEEIFRVQGKAQAVQELIADIEEAGQRLQRSTATPLHRGGQT